MMRIIWLVVMMVMASPIVLSSVVMAKPLVGIEGSSLNPQVIARLKSPWALRFLDAGHMLITTKSGSMFLVTTKGQTTPIQGMPPVFEGGQGGLGDVMPHPNFTQNRLVYFSFVASNDDGKTRFARVIRGQLTLGADPHLSNLEVIWDQTPARPGRGHFSHRLAFGPEGTAEAGDLFITSGDRQEQTPAQDWQSSLGKIIRLHDDGSIPQDNPFQDKGDLAKTFWTLGHRNALGISFDGKGQLWAHEMGPRHGDELNLITKGENYGWPLVSEGRQYSGAQIPSHDTRPEFTPPKAFWVPTIAPSGLIFYDGDEFPAWQGHAFIGGLKSRALIRVAMDGGQAVEAERFEWAKRVRDVAMAPDGSIWVIEDGNNGRLIRFTNPE